MVEWLESQHWDVYQEVSAYGSVADIVAVQNKLVWVVECKTSLSLSLIAQAVEWRKRAHFITVAIPKSKTNFSKTRRFALETLKSYGIGVLMVKIGDIDCHTIKPNIFRKARTNHLISCLSEKQKVFAPAGSCGGGYWTPYKETCKRIVRAVKRNPGIILKDLIDGIDHHYANDKSAKASIRYWIQTGKIKGVRCEKDGKFLRFYPENETTT